MGNEIGKTIMKPNKKQIEERIKEMELEGYASPEDSRYIKIQELKEKLRRLENE